MNNYLELAAINARHNARQSRMTIFCIILAIFLVTSVFSMVDFEYIHMKEKLIRDHGNWHIMLSNVSKEEAEGVRKEADVKAAVWYDTLNYGLDKEFYLDGHPLCVIGTESSFLDDFFPGTLREGHFPQSDSEVLLNLNAKNALGYAVEDQAVFQTPTGTYSYTVSGFAADTSKSLASDAMIAILDLHAFEALAEVNGQQREMQYYIQFGESMKIKSTIADLKASHGWTNENFSENTALLGIMGMSTSNYVVGLYGIAAFLVILVVLAGVFMISGSMNANIAERTQFFGMLRCIGAGKRQVRQIVRFEALAWLKWAVPAGIALSIVFCWGICAVLAYGIGGEWEGMPVWHVSITGIVLGILVGIITVLLSASSPAKRAAKVSPIAAVSGNQTGSYSGRSLDMTAGKVDVSLGIHHAVSKRKNLLMMTGSFALSIILFLVFSVMIDWVQNALTSNKPYTPDLSVFYEDYAAGLDSAFAGKLRDTEGVKNAYGRMYLQADVTSKTGVNRIDLISYDDVQFQWAKKDRLRGSIGDTQNQIGNVMVVFEKNNALDLGDTLELNGKTLRVSALLSDSPFSGSDIPTVICSEETFEEFCGPGNYSVIDLQLEKSSGDETVAEIRALLEPDMRLSDRRADKTEANSTYLAFTVLVYGFLAMVGLIAVFNIINSISMSTAARHREYGMMRAIGLEKSQLTKMITAESMTYAVSGCLAGCAVGIPLNELAYKTIITNYFGTPWKVPVIELLIIFAVVLGSALIAVHAPAKQLSESPIVETINM